MKAIHQQTVDRWLQELGGFKLDADDRCIIELAEEQLTVLVDVPSDGSEFHLYASVLPMGADLDAEQLRRALELNLFQEATAGGAIAFDSVNDQLVYCYRRPVAETDETAFQNIVLNFFRIANGLRVRLREEASDAATGAVEEVAAEPAAAWLKM